MLVPLFGAPEQLGIGYNPNGRRSAAIPRPVRKRQLVVRIRTDGGFRLPTITPNFNHNLTGDVADRPNQSNSPNPNINWMVSIDHLLRRGYHDASAMSEGCNRKSADAEQFHSATIGNQRGIYGCGGCRRSACRLPRSRLQGRRLSRMRCHVSPLLGSYV